ncbi:hypothetical protein SAMN04487969_12352 [Paenibacillus algorifonticola]|uniref:Uncharacterized protein n=1 Tax=Paenibacillus algorifonticola TaxID=684063 RepID=A0A1I2HI32_9BACL|nr:hypothetical protein [Paenibacillus algorifonticola]SFF28960.1 hypothetical protein SAMN04487969_12352 [Paenibacillus algorifonticola]
MRKPASALQTGSGYSYWKRQVTTADLEQQASALSESENWYFQHGYSARRL